jgi:hypothetical protein
MIEIPPLKPSMPGRTFGNAPQKVIDKANKVREAVQARHPGANVKIEVKNKGNGYLFTVSADEEGKSVLDMADLHTVESVASSAALESSGGTTRIIADMIVKAT